MRNFYLIGFPLGHSFSQSYFAAKFKNEGIAHCVYMPFAMPQLSGFRAWALGNPFFAGCNVTIPYKKQIIPFLDRLDDTARAVGAVNTVTLTNGLLTGYNTDVFGFEASLKGLTLAGKKSLIIGNGGAAAAAKYVLAKMDMQVQVYTRHPNTATIADSQLNDAVAQSHLIVQATPLGMFPHTETYPDIPYGQIGDRHVCMDMVYNPENTKFMQKCAAQGAQVIGGLTMLHAQADEAWRLFNKG